MVLPWDCVPKGTRQEVSHTVIFGQVGVVLTMSIAQEILSVTWTERQEERKDMYVF